MEWIQLLTLPSDIHKSILDVGTGSGCIAISLKTGFPGSTVHAIDISPDALSVAKKNAEINAAEIIFYEGDILAEDFRNSVVEKYDLIVSNPPYIRMTEMNAMADRVKNHEPHSALFVKDNDPLIFYKAIAEFGKAHLKENGLLFFEINEALGKEVRNLCIEGGFRNAVLKKDISGKNRMLLASGFST